MNWNIPVDGEHNLFICRSKCNVFTKCEHQNLLTGSWRELPVLLRCYRANIKLTFLQQGKQFNCVPSKLFGCSSCAVSQVKEGRPARSVGRSFHAPGWSLAAQHLATTLCVWMKVVWSGAERDRAFQTFIFPDWSIIAMNTLLVFWLSEKLFLLYFTFLFLLWSVNSVYLRILSDCFCSVARFFIS